MPLYVCVRMEQPTERTDPRIAQDPTTPQPQAPVGEPNTPEIPGTDKQGWFDDKKPGFPSSEDPDQRAPGPTKPGLDPNPNPEPIFEPGGEDLPPEGPQPPNVYPNPSGPQDPYDRPPVDPQGGSKPDTQPRD